MSQCIFMATSESPFLYKHHPSSLTVPNTSADITWTTTRNQTSNTILARPNLWSWHGLLDKRSQATRRDAERGTFEGIGNRQSKKCLFVSPLSQTGHLSSLRVSDSLQLLMSHREQENVKQGCVAF